MNPRQEFSLEAYRGLLEQAKAAGFAFQSFTDYLAAPRDKLVLLRHDVDVSLEYALRLAQVERELQIKSTYFVRLHARFYGLDDADNRRRVRQLADWGFEIGLHQEAARFVNTMPEVIAFLQRDKARLEDLICQTVTGVSCHLPKHQFFQMDDALLAQTGFAYNPGGARFNRDAVFVSDSNRTWKQYSLAEALDLGDKVLANIHPVWWAPGELEAEAVIRALLAGE
jgi:hypothetical protein